MLTGIYQKGIDISGHRYTEAALREWEGRPRLTC